MVLQHYPIGVAAHWCRPALLLRRRTLTTTLLHRRSFMPPSLSPASSSTPPPSPSPWRRRLAADDHDDGFFTVGYDPGDLDQSDQEEGSPWEGALVYRRDAAVHHLEYTTTLERLGLADLSSPHSRARAAAMGILSSSRKPPGDATEDDETPVLVSVDLARRRGRLRLDGIVRTVITLGCYSHTSF